jgi:hypothetical protein
MYFDLDPHMYTPDHLKEHGLLRGLTGRDQTSKRGCVKLDQSNEEWRYRVSEMHPREPIGVANEISEGT